MTGISGFVAWNPLQKALGTLAVLGKGGCEVKLGSVPALVQDGL